MQEVLTEVTPLDGRDCFVIIDRRKNGFNFPIHKHSELELNFIQGARGATRIIGDSIETIGDLELVLIGESDMEHAWLQGECRSEDIREITIQFSPSLFDNEIMEKSQFLSLKKMLSDSKRGISFSRETIVENMAGLEKLLEETDGFRQVLGVLSILDSLSRGEYVALASSLYADSFKGKSNGRIDSVKQFIENHITEKISLENLASLAGMSTSTFCRYFKKCTGRTMANYIIDLRLANASRALLDTKKNISEICYSCGFNNISHFNRLFKERKNMTPTEFRSIYKKNTVVV